MYMAARPRIRTRTRSAERAAERAAAEHAAVRSCCHVRERYVRRCAAAVGACLVIVAVLLFCSADLGLGLVLA